MKAERLILVALVTLVAGGGRDAVAQHDQARDAVRLIAQGKVTRALNALEKPDAGHHSPLAEKEKLFARVLAACQQGDGATAWQTAREALQQGMPIARFQAGPREALAPLYAQDEYGDYIAEHGRSLLHGPHLGSVTDRTARVWVRTAEAADVDIVLTPKQADADSDAAQ